MSESAAVSQLRGGPDRGHLMHAVTGQKHNVALATRTERAYQVAVLSGARVLKPAVGMAVRAAGLDGLIEIFPTV